MKRGTSRRSAVVGDRRPLERNLARFLLEERGFVVAMETATAADTARAVEQLRPDVVLVHEDVVAEPGATLVRDIRAASGSTRLILLTSDRAAADPTLLASADAVVEEGPGLTELETALTVRPARAVAGAIPFAAAAAKRRRAPRSERKWVERLQGAAAASIIVLAVVLARGVGTPGPDAGGEAGEHVAATEQALETLAEELSNGSAVDPDQVDDLARDLIEEYNSAIALGADEAELQAEILAVISPLIEDLPDDVVALLAGILGDALVYGGSPSEVPLPSPIVSDAPSPEPEPTPPVEEPSPQPSAEVSETPEESPEPELSPPAEESPSPSETQSESPSPTETESESPSPSPSESESPSPSPSESESPSPSPSQTEPPSPTQTETPSPTQTETPSPSQTETPSPSETQTPTPTKSENPSPTKSHSPTPKPSDQCRSGPDPCASSGSTTAGTIYAVPPGIVLLLLTSGLARRRSKRRGR